METPLALAAPPITSQDPMEDSETYFGKEPLLWSGTQKIQMCSSKMSCLGSKLSGVLFASSLALDMYNHGSPGLLPLRSSNSSFRVFCVVTQLSSAWSRQEGSLDGGPSMMDRRHRTRVVRPLQILALFIIEKMNGDRKKRIDRQTK